MTKSEKYWRGHVESWRKSGEVARVYAARVGVSVGTLLWWSSKLGKQQAPKLRLARVERGERQAPQAVSGVIIEWPALGARMMVSSEGESEILERVAVALAAAQRRVRQ